MPLGFWYLTGDLRKPSTDYPYGLTRPFEQQGLLIELTRLVGLVLGLVSMVFYGRALYRFTGSAMAVFLALCSWRRALNWPSNCWNQADGLMLAFLMA